MMGDTGGHIDAAAPMEYLPPMSTLRRISYLMGMVVVAAVLTIAGFQAVSAAMGWL